MDDSSNRRKTRSSGRKKASTKVAGGQDTSQIPDGSETKSKPSGASPGRSSPEPDCAICLGRLQNKSFTDRCFHMFCFVCLQEWSKVKAECPLCKQKFTSIIHNVRSNEDYDQYPIPPKIPSWQEQARNFRYHTTLTLERRLQINIPDFRQHPQYQEHDYTLQRPSIHNHMTTRSHWRRQRQASSSDFRRRIYLNNLRLVEVTDPRMRTRDTTPNFFRSNPACTHRLVPWLNRELNALLQTQHDQVQFVLELIMGLIKRVAITSEEFYEGVYPYVGRHARHFMHEFENFARSPYNIAAYDQHAVYQPQTLAVESDSDTDSILSVGNDQDDDDVIVISPGQETVRRRHPSPPHHQRDQESLTYRDLSPLLHRVRSLLEYPESSHLSVNTPGWDSPTPGPSWAAETEVSDSSAAVTNVDDETLLGDRLRTAGDAHTAVKTEDECDIDVEHSRSNSSSNDSDTDSSKAGSDIVFVGYDRPWQERSPILLSSTDDDDITPQSTSNSTAARMTKHKDDKKSQSDRHKKRSSELSKNYSRSSKRRRTRSRSRSRSRSQSRSSFRHGSYWRKRSNSRSRSRYLSGHRRHRSRSRDRSGSKRKRTSSPSSHDHLSSINRSRMSSSLLSWDQKRHRSKSSSVEITYVKRKKSKQKKKEKKHHKKHKSRKHKRRKRASDSEESQENMTTGFVRPRSSVTVVNKTKDPLQKSECPKDETLKSDDNTEYVSSTTLQSKSPESNMTSSEQTMATGSTSSGSALAESPDLKVVCNSSLDSKLTSSESNIKKPYKKHPTGHKKSVQNKSASQCTSVDHKHTTATDTGQDKDSEQPSKSCESLVKTGATSGSSTQSSESSDRENPDQVPTIRGQEIQSPHLSDDRLDTPEVESSSVLDSGLGNQKDSVDIDVVNVSCNSYNDEVKSTPGKCSNETQPSTNSRGQNSKPILSEVSAPTIKDSYQTDDSTDGNQEEQCELKVTDIPQVSCCNAESSYNPTDYHRESDNTTGKHKSSPCIVNSQGPSTPQLGHQTSTIEILDSDSSLNSDSDTDNDVDESERSANFRSDDHRRSCVIVASPPNATIGYPRYSNEQDEISSNAISDANNLANTNSNQSQPNSPCLYSSPMYNCPIGSNLAIPSFNSLFHSSSASIMRTDSFVSNMAMSISTAGIQSQHMTNHVYRASPGGQWESHHSAHSISRANMGNVEVVQTMSGVAHSNLYGSTCSATSSTMAYIPRTTSGQCLPNTSLQSYTSAEQSYMSNASTSQQYIPSASQEQLLPNSLPQANCPLNRSSLPIEGGSQISSLPSYYTSPSSSSLWSHDRHIEVADSSEGDADVDVLYLSDNEDELREINIMDITDEESCGDGSHVVDLGSVDLISDDSDVEIEETSGPTDSVCETMINGVLPHGSVSEAVLEDDAERSRRTTCDVSVCVSDEEEDTASHTTGQLSFCSSSEEDNNILYGASCSEDKALDVRFSSDENVNCKEKFSSKPKTFDESKFSENISEEYDDTVPSSSSYHNTSIYSDVDSDKPISSINRVECHNSSSEKSHQPESLDSSFHCPNSDSQEVLNQLPSSSTCTINHSSSSKSDIPVSGSSSFDCPESGLQEDSSSREYETERESFHNMIGNLSYRNDMVNCDVLNKEIYGPSETNERNLDSVNGSSNQKSPDRDAISPICDESDVGSDNVERNIKIGQCSKSSDNCSAPSGQSSDSDTEEVESRDKSTD